MFLISQDKHCVLYILPIYINKNAYRPYGIREFGLIPGVLLLSFSAYLSYFSLDLILVACNHLPHGTHPSYTVLSQLAGGKCLSRLAQTALMVQFFGAIVGYLVAAGGLMDLVWTVCGGNGHVYMYVILLLSGVIIWPLSLMRDMSSLRHTALLGFCCSTYLGVTVFIEYFLLCDNTNVRTSKYLPDLTKQNTLTTCFWKASEMHLFADQLFPIRDGWISVIKGFLTSFPLFVFSFTC